MSTVPARFMRIALEEGRKALPACIPNPPVGCVLVRDGHIVAKGFTQPPYQPHAEAVALAQLDGDLSDITAYVTLEPCSFHGRTPSCAITLADRGIRQIFVALVDPDSRNCGAGIALLQSRGVEVTVGLLAEEALQDLGPYLALPANKRVQPALDSPRG